MTEKKLLEQLADKLHMKHYSRKTVTAYVTMIYLHILQPGGAGVESPLDKLESVQWNIIRQ